MRNAKVFCLKLTNSLVGIKMALSRNNIIGIFELYHIVVLFESNSKKRWWDYWGCEIFYASSSGNYHGFAFLKDHNKDQIHTFCQRILLRRENLIESKVLIEKINT